MSGGKKTSQSKWRSSTFKTHTIALRCAVSHVSFSEMPVHDDDDDDEKKAITHNNDDDDELRRRR